MTALIWTLIGFLFGSLPFSVWLGRLVLRTDIRDYGDGNPGGAPDSARVTGCTYPGGETAQYLLLHARARHGEESTR